MPINRLVLLAAAIAVGALAPGRAAVAAELI